MRRWILAATLGMLVGTNTGCILPTYHGDPAKRTEQLIHTSEDLRMLDEEWARFWFRDQPSHMTPLRTHGGILY